MGIYNVLFNKLGMCENKYENYVQTQKGGIAYTQQSRIYHFLKSFRHFIFLRDLKPFFQTLF